MMKPILALKGPGSTWDLTGRQTGHLADYSTNINETKNSDEFPILTVNNSGGGQIGGQAMYATQGEANQSLDISYVLQGGVLRFWYIGKLLEQCMLIQ